MSEDVTTKPHEGESPTAPSHLPHPAEWPKGDEVERRDLTEYEEPPEAS